MRNKTAHLIKEYTKYIIAEQRTNSNNIIQAIINKFPSEYTPGDGDRGPPGDGGPALRPALAPDKRVAFWERYNTDEAFRKKMNSSYTYKKGDYFDFWQNSDEFREYLKPELKSAEVILVEPGKASALRINDVRSALEIAENVEEFVEMVRASIQANYE